MSIGKHHNDLMLMISMYIVLLRSKMSMIIIMKRIKKYNDKMSMIPGSKKKSGFSIHYNYKTMAFLLRKTKLK